MTYSFPDAQPKCVISSMHAPFPAHRILQLATPMLHAEYTLPGRSLVNFLRSLAISSYIQIFSTVLFPSPSVYVLLM
jgi:hypothetical protein